MTGLNSWERMNLSSLSPFYFAEFDLNSVLSTGLGYNRGTTEGIGLADLSPFTC